MNAQFVIDDSSVHLWAFTIEPTELAAMEFRPFLSVDEQLRANHFRFAHLHNAYIICRGLVRLLLGRYLDTDPGTIEFDYQPKGKPVIANLRLLDFNLSHTAGMMLCGVTKACEIGVDIERLRPLCDIQELARRFFSVEEADELLSLPCEQLTSAFYRCWTRKEAYLKAVGEGLSAPLHSFRVTLRPMEEVRFIHIGGDTELAQSWRLSEVELGESYIATLAYSGPERAVRLTRNVTPLDFLVN